MIKLLGYLLAYLLMTAIFMVGFAGVGIIVTAVIAFVTWSLPAVELASVDWWVVLRIVFSVASLFGIWFACGREGKAFANEFKNSFYREYDK